MGDRSTPAPPVGNTLGGLRSPVHEPAQQTRDAAASVATPSTPAAAGVVLAAGGGVRFGAGHSKAYVPLAGRRLASWALNSLAATAAIGPLVLVVRAQDRPAVRRIIEREVPDQKVEIVSGGESRQASELNALRHLASRIDAGDIDVVVMHDAARPLASPTLAAGVIHVARQQGGAILGVPADDLVKVSDTVVLDRPSTGLIRSQTPQAFAAAALLAAYEEAARAGYVGTDTSSVIERFSDIDVQWVMGEPRNLKITYPRDLFLAERILEAAGYQLP